MTRGQGVRRAVTLALPGALTVWFGFNAGGFFVAAPALAALVVACVLLVHLTTADRPLEGVSPMLIAVLVAFGSFAAWILLSSSWSGAAGRTLAEYDRALLYFLILVLFGLLPRSADSLRWILRGIAAAFVVLSGAGFLARALPTLVSVDQSFIADRLSYPTTYSNTTGLCAGLGLVLCAALTSDAREHRVVQVCAAAALPLTAATLVLTLSRGGMLASVAGLLVFAVAGRPRVAASAFLSSALPTAAAAAVAYASDTLLSDTPTAPEAVSEGRLLAVVVAAAALIAAALRYGLGPFDRWLALRRAAPTRRQIARLSAVALVFVLVSSAGLNVPGAVGRQFDRFVDDDSGAALQDGRERLASPGNNGRLDLWGAAIDMFEEDPLRGRGAGSFQAEWLQRRPAQDDAVDAHSLFVETLAETGIVGILLLGCAVLLALVGLGRRARGPDRVIYAAALAAVVVWVMRSAIDWDWEMPVVTAWVFAVAGVGVAAGPATPPRGGLGRGARVAAGLVVLVLLVTPAQLAQSQSRLNQAVDALKANRCERSIGLSLQAAELVPSRPEPFELLAYCNSRLGRHDLAERAASTAIDRNPGLWEYHYDLALVRAAAGEDPRAAAAQASRLNPQGDIPKEIVDAFDSDSPRVWRRRALGARLLIP